MKNHTISLYLDERRPKKNGKCPLKIRVFLNKPRKQKFYRTNFEFTKDEFESTWKTSKPKKAFKEKRIQLQAIENKANEVADSLNPFTFDAFEKKLFGSHMMTECVFGRYDYTINKLKENGQVGTAETYSLSLKSIKKFLKKRKRKEPVVLLFQEITPDWLEKYERFMNDEEKSITTISIYLRALRAIFNNAIADNLISPEIYPFGKRKYTIPAHKNVKKALSKEQLKVLFETEPDTPDQEKARDFWFFSYACNGMNFKDIAYLQYKNITGDKLTYRRAKTTKTDQNQIPISITLNDFKRSVIEKYGNSNKNPDNYIFNIIDPATDPETKHYQIKNFVRFVNQHFIKFAKKAGVDEKISTYWARHSFATNAIRSGASMEMVSELLNHSNMNTTKGYFAGFDDEKRKEIEDKLMDF